ncbi:uncharacterized protein LOC120357833 isoform X2 [Solenopsis invicta]|uniref:uncharacterized protein LOC120357833 isoform X2 n=1 Tax=Solenopsis invicta TaxID=13686 RepID=UPI00193E72E2|nr:uncharacterized protein LOC120357833 isoform X2 [Solenopsis invicta]
MPEPLRLTQGRRQRDQGRAPVAGHTEPDLSRGRGGIKRRRALIPLGTGLPWLPPGCPAGILAKGNSERSTGYDTCLPLKGIFSPICKAYEDVVVVLQREKFQLLRPISTFFFGISIVRLR